MILNREEYKSIFGGTNTESVISEGPDGLDNVSVANSKASSQQANAEADLGTSSTERYKIQAQQTKLSKLESGWKLHESQIMVEMKQKQAEVELKLEEEKTRLKRMQADMNVKVAAGRVQAYNTFEGEVENVVGELCETVPVVRTITAMTLSRPTSTGATLLQPQTSPQSLTASLAEANAGSLSLNRLPLPEPTVFAGDPLKFVDFKMSFLTLIGRKPIPASKKMFYKTSL